MTAKTSTERGREYRRRQKLLKGLHEVRGIWAPKDKHAVIKVASKQFGAESK